VAKDNLASHCLMIYPKKISFVLLKAFIGPFIITFLVSLFIFELQFIWLYIDDLLGKDLEFMVILKLLIFASARIVNMALPLAVLMSSIMTIGALSEHNELTAMKSAGISLNRIFRPLIIFISIIALSAFVFANNIWPVANLKFRTLLFSIVQQKPALNLEEGTFYNGIEGISIRVNKKDAETGTLHDVLIYDHRDPGRGSKSVIRAESGNMEQTDDKRWLILTLNNGYTYDEVEEKNKRVKKYPALRSQFKQMTLRIDISSLFFNKDDEEVFKNAYEMMTILQLDQALDGFKIKEDSLRQLWFSNNTKKLRLEEVENQTGNSQKAKSMMGQLPVSIQYQAASLAMDETRKDIVQTQRAKIEFEENRRLENRHRIEWHRKFFLAISCWVLFFIGAPLGAILRKGGLGLPSVIALLLFIVFEVLTIAGEKMTKAFIVEPWLGIWLSTIVMAPVCFVLMHNANREKKWSLPQIKMPKSWRFSLKSKA
jgi:lipopolysaccharide export system permease protein